jgi:hypothetical protein
MADLGKVFNANSYEELGDFAPIPAGDYNVCIDSTVRKPLNKESNGDKLVVVYVINDGDHANRKLFDNLNLWHTESPDAVQFAERTLAQICRVVGKDQITNAEELVGCNLSVRVEQEEYDGKIYNRVRAYNKLNGSSPTSSTETKDDKKNAMPWEK